MLHTEHHTFHSPMQYCLKMVTGHRPSNNSFVSHCNNFYEENCTNAGLLFNWIIVSLMIIIHQHLRMTSLLSLTVLTEDWALSGGEAPVPAHLR